uniref:MD-2-related lipid-recognition domain-containing protein n=1 Tax=Stomoxys calcitrans TaxID=35570 RepID=A0A1I8P9H5_STOCA
MNFPGAHLKSSRYRSHILNLCSTMLGHRGVLAGIAIFWAFLWLPAVQLKRNYKLEFTKCSSFHNTSNVRAFQFFLRNDTHRLNVMDGRIELANTIEEFQTKVVVKIWRKNSPPFTLADLVFDGCDFMDTMQKNKILAIFKRNIMRYINEFPRCPLKKNFNYTLTGYHLNEDDFPSYVPDGEFQVQLHFFQEKKLYARALFWGQVINLKSDQIKR